MTSKRAGFTLVELLVVVTIIGILIALLFPVYSTIIRSVQETYCQGNLGQLAKVISSYCQANDGFFPFVGNKQVTTVTPSASDWLYVPDQRNKIYLFSSKNPSAYGDMERGVLLKNKLVGKLENFYCPTDQDLGLVRGPQNTLLGNTLRYEIANVFPQVIRPATSYVINGSITYGNNSISGTPGVHKMSDFGPWTFLFIEESSGDTEHGEKSSACNKAYMIPYIDDANPTLRWLTSRHRGGGYIACMDGHVEWMLPENPDNATDPNTFKASLDEVSAGVSGGLPWYYVTKTRWNP